MILFIEKAQEKLGVNFELGIGSSEKMTEQYKKTVIKIFTNLQFFHTKKTT